MKKLLNKMLSVAVILLALSALAADDVGSAFNWDGESEEGLFQMYSDLVKKTILRHPDCPKATITLKTRPGQKLTKEEQIEAIEVVLEMNGIHLEPYGENFIRALPRKDARKEGIPLIMDAETKLGESGRVVSMMIPFRNIAIEEAQKALEGLKSNSGILLVFERTNSILVTDTEQNINRMLEIARSIDIATPVLENVFVRQIKYASAEEIKTALEAIVLDSQKELEKNGKQVAQNQAQQSAHPLGPQTRRLGLQGRQPEVPVNNESLVMSVSDADRGMIRGKTLILSDQRSNKLIIVTMKTNMDFFDKVIEQLDVETTPDIVVKVYRLKYADSEDVSDMINDLIGNAASSKSSSKSNQNAASKSGSGANLSRNTATTAKKSVNQRTGEAKTGELSKENTTVLSDKRINGIVVMTQKDLVPVVETIIESMDVKLSQVLIETCIIEVTLGDTLKTGVDWVRTGRFWDDNKDMEKGTMANGDRAFASMVGGGGGTGTAALQSIMNVTTNGLVEASSYMGTANPIGAGLNYFFKSDALNLAAVISAAKTDNRSKYIASPVVMTVDNKEATIEATDSRQFLTGWQAVSSSYAGSGLPSPNYSATDIGIKLKVTPKINPNGTVMLEVEEEYSQSVIKQEMLSPNGQLYEPKEIDVPSKRTMSSDVILENGQTVVFGGLTETTTSEYESGIPILKEIPVFGKWLFGKVEKTESRKELLVFMTPYVFNDADEAAREARRRKTALSDGKPWDDHGWSASPLADPVSQKEKLRRLKDEWTKQDAERAAQMAIEQEKLKRVKAVEEMSKAERDAWLELHKESLGDKEKDALEEKLEAKTPESEEELKRLAEAVREKKLSEAESKLEADSKLKED